MPTVTPTTAPLHTARAVRKHRSSRVGWTWIVLSSLAIAVYAVTPYVTTPLHELAGGDVGLAAAYDGSPAWVHAVFYTHIAAGGIALVLAPFQFWAGLRRRLPTVHRMIGRVYLCGVLVSGSAALALAPVNSAGMVGFFGFGTLAVVWLWTA